MTFDAARVRAMTLRLRSGQALARQPARRGRYSRHGRNAPERRYTRRAAGRKLEGLHGFGLDGVDLADGDGGDVEVFSTGWRAGEAAEHGELADVGEGVGDRALHEALNGRLDGRGRGEVGIEGGESGEETLLLLRPGEELRVVPGGVSLGHGERPVKEVAHVGEDLHGTATGAVEVGE